MSVFCTYILHVYLHTHFCVTLFVQRGQQPVSKKGQKKQQRAEEKAKKKAETQARLVGQLQCLHRKYLWKLHAKWKSNNVLSIVLLCAQEAEAAVRESQVRLLMLCGLLVWELLLLGCIQGVVWFYYVDSECWENW